MKTFTLVLFLATYILMVLLPKKRVYVALASAVIFVAAGIVPVAKVPQAISWNVLMMIAGTMITVGLFIESKMPVRIADKLLQRSKNAVWVVIYMSLFAGIISAFVDNVATVLMVAPVGLAIAKKLKISPVPMLVCISVSSNLQGAATLVGDTTSILLGDYAGLDFIDFFFAQIFVKSPNFISRINHQHLSAFSKTRFLLSGEVRQERVRTVSGLKPLG